MSAARREVTNADKAVAYARRSDYRAARAMRSAELLAGVTSYARTCGGNVSGEGERVQLRMLENLATRRLASTRGRRNRGRAYVAGRTR
jgi:hypothetical protein